MFWKYFFQKLLALLGFLYNLSIFPIALEHFAILHLALPGRELSLPNRLVVYLYGALFKLKRLNASPEKAI